MKTQEHRVSLAKLERWKLSEKVDAFCEGSLSKFLTKFDPCVHREVLILIADDCYARLEKLEDEEVKTK